MSGNAFFMLRANVNEMNVQPIDLGDELRKRVQLRLAPAPVVFLPPVLREVSASSRVCTPWRRIRYRLPIRPPGRVDAPAQFG
jgi:hypothetical protein